MHKHSVRKLTVVDPSSSLKHTSFITRAKGVWEPWQYSHPSLLPATGEPLLKHTMVDVLYASPYHKTLQPFPYLLFSFSADTSDEVKHEAGNSFLAEISSQV